MSSSIIRPKLLVYQRLMLTGYTAQVFNIATVKYSIFCSYYSFFTTHTSLGSEHALHQILCILCDVKHVQNRAMDVYNCMCVCVCVCARARARVCVCVCFKSHRPSSRSCMSAVPSCHGFPPYTVTQIYSELINFEQSRTMIFWNLASFNESVSFSDI